MILILIQRFRSIPRTIAGLLATVLLTTTLVACSSSGSDAGRDRPPDDDGATIGIVATTDVYGDIARTVAGDAAQVTAIVSGTSVDPHDYEVVPRDQLALSRADIVIVNGGGYDDFMDRMLASSDTASDPVVLNVVEISGFEPDDDGELNEHVWYDLPTMAKLADRLADALAHLDPDGAATFRSNAAAFDDDLDGLIARTDDLARAHGGAGVAITEPVPLYLLEAAGLDNLTPAEFSEAVEEGIGVPAAVLHRTLELVEDGRVEVLVPNVQTRGAETDKLIDTAKSNDVPVVGVTETLPDGKSYVEWMHDNLDRLAAALG